MPLQVEELRLDAEDHVVDPRSYPKRLDAIETIEKLIARLEKAHYETNWLAIARDGKTRFKFIIEGV